MEQHSNVCIIHFEIPSTQKLQMWRISEMVPRSILDLPLKSTYAMSVPSPVPPTMKRRKSIHPMSGAKEQRNPYHKTPHDETTKHCNKKHCDLGKSVNCAIQFNELFIEYPTNGDHNNTIKAPTIFLP